MPEVLRRVLDAFSLDCFLASRAASSAWRQRVQDADVALRDLYALRFGFLRPGSEPSCWIQGFAEAFRAQREAIQTWRVGNLRPRDLFVFKSYVRSWASDEEMLVAGMYNGGLQPLSWLSDRPGKPFEHRHGDEVTCIDMNSEHVLSGSGDPGYYRRRPNDPSVKLWRRDGTLLGSSRHHSDSVRGVALFPTDSQLSGYAVSGGLDQLVSLLSLVPFEQVACLRLRGPCRSLQAVLPVSRWSMPLSGSEIRVLASAGEEVIELAIKATATSGPPSLSALRSVSMCQPGIQISGLSYHAQASVWEGSPAGEDYPAGLLGAAGFSLACGTVDGHLCARSFGETSEGRRGAALQRSFPSRGAESNSMQLEVISVVFLDKRCVLAIGRCGILCMVEWDYACASSKVLWAAQGFRMYVSTMQLREPLLLVSDGFDNAVRTILAAPAETDSDDNRDS